jgi:hypothetical protein
MRCPDARSSATIPPFGSRRTWACLHSERRPSPS